MVCSKCGSKQILRDEELFCPKCNNFQLMSKEKALEVVSKQVEFLDKSFKEKLRKFHRIKLIDWLAKEREEVASRLFTVHVLELDKFYSVNALIKKVMGDLDFEGEDEANEENTSELIDAYAEYLKFSDANHLIDGGLKHCHQEKKFELNRISSKDFLRNYGFYDDEAYLPIIETFKSNLIFDEEGAKKHFDENKEEYEDILKTKGNPEHRTPREMIHLLYPDLQRFFSALRKSKSYSDLFDLEYLKNQNISPEFILGLIKEFTQQEGQLTYTNAKDFKARVRKKFKNVDKQVAYNSLVFKKENQNIFPFFIELEGKLSISFSFVKTMCIFYYPFYHRKLYDEETQKRSKIFEEETVPAKLKRIGYKVISSYTDKKNASLQIDQIAWKNDKLIVIETKIWDIKPFFEHINIHEHIKRDLKGIVDGKKFTIKDGVLTEKKVRSLIDKIRHVGKNISEICPDFENIKKISGAVITNLRPTLNEYREIKFRGFSRINEI